MERFLENLYKLIIFVVSLIAIVVEIPIKVFSTLLFLTIFIVLAFFAPVVNKFATPDWWDNWTEYVKHPCTFKLVQWVWKNY